jgi:hypothetical protein
MFVFANPKWLRSRFHFPCFPPFVGSLIARVSMVAIARKRAGPNIDAFCRIDKVRHAKEAAPGIWRSDLSCDELRGSAGADFCG